MAAAAEWPAAYSLWFDLRKRMESVAGSFEVCTCRSCGKFVRSSVSACARWVGRDPRSSRAVTTQDDKLRDNPSR